MSSANIPSQQQKNKSKSNPYGKQVFITVRVFDQDYQINVRENWQIKNIVLGYINNGYFGDQFNIDDINVYDHHSNKPIDMQTKISGIVIGDNYQQICIRIMDKNNDPLANQQMQQIQMSKILKMQKLEQISRNSQQTIPKYRVKRVSQSQQQIKNRRQKSRQYSQQLLTNSVIDDCEINNQKQQIEYKQHDAIKNLLQLWSHNQHYQKQRESSISHKISDQIYRLLKGLLERAEVAQNINQRINSQFQQFYNQYCYSFRNIIHNISEFSVEKLSKNIDDFFFICQQKFKQLQQLKSQYQSINLQKTFLGQKKITESNLNLGKTLKKNLSIKDSKLVKHQIDKSQKSNYKDIQSTNQYTQYLKSQQFQISQQIDQSQILKDLKKYKQENNSLSAKAQTYVLCSVLINNQHYPLEELNLFRQLRNITGMQIKKLNILLVLRNNTRQIQEKLKFQVVNKMLGVLPTYNNNNILIILTLFAEGRDNNSNKSSSRYKLAIFSQGGIKTPKKKFRPGEIKSKTHIINLENRKIYEQQGMQINLTPYMLYFCGNKITLGYHNKYNIGLNIKKSKIRQDINQDVLLVQSIQIYNVQTQNKSNKAIS